MREAEWGVSGGAPVEAEQVLGPVAVACLTGQRVEPKHREGARRGAGRPRVVLGRPRPMHQRLAVFGCEVQTVVPELLVDEIDELVGAFEVPLLERGLVQVDQRLGQERVVVEKTGHPRRPVLPGTVDAAVGHGHLVGDEVDGASGSLQVAGVPGRLVRGAQPLDHERVPAGQDVLAPPRTSPPRPGAEELFAQTVQARLFLRIEFDGAMEDRGAMLEVAVLADTVGVAGERSGILAQRGVHLLGGPDVELATRRPGDRRCRPLPYGRA